MPRKKSRKRWCAKPYYIIECQDCDWKLEGVNALGTAAKHHDSTEHTVRVEATQTFYYQTEESMIKKFGKEGTERRIRG